MADPATLGMPMLGLGTRHLPFDLTGVSVYDAIEVGYRHIDCAYENENEVEIGPVFSSRPENDIFVTSKLGSAFHSPYHVKEACLETLNYLHREKLDMYLINNPIRFEMHAFPLWFSKGWLQETWRQMILLKESGLVKHIGVSNCTITKLSWLCENDVKPENNQVELHPYLPQDKLLAYCKENISAYAPLGSYRTTSRSRMCKSDNHPQLMEDLTLAEIAKRNNTTVASVLIKWGLMRGTPLIVRSQNPKHILENFQAQSLTLSDKDVKKINSLYPSHNARYYDFSAIEPTEDIDMLGIPADPLFD